MRSGPPAPEPGQRGLSDLYEEVNRARRVVTEQRGVHGLQPWAAVAAQGELLAALESYAAALESVHRPLPYRLRDELRLYRALTTPTLRSPRRAGPPPRRLGG